MMPHSPVPRSTSDAADAGEARGRTHTTPLHLAAPEDHSVSGVESPLALRQALIVAQVGPLVAAEAHPVRRARLVARAAAAIGSGSAILWQLDRATGTLIALARIEGATQAPGILGASSGVIALPELRHLRTGEGAAGHVVITGTPFLSHDFAAETRLPAGAQATTAEIFGQYPLAFCAVPLLERDTLVGVLEVARFAPSPGFDAHTLGLLQSLTALGALALALEAREGDLRHEQERIIHSQEEERRRLARDLHDGPVQAIANAAMTLEQIDDMLAGAPGARPATPLPSASDHARLELRRLYERMISTAHDLRGMIFDLRPVTLVTDGLEVALEDLIASYDVPLPRIVLQSDLPGRLPAAIESTLFLVIREALQNVIRHAHATECLVQISQITGGVRAAVQDNGIGFDPDAVLAHYPHGHSWGLLNMHERVHALARQFAIRSRPGIGTVVEVEIPFR